MSTGFGEASQRSPSMGECRTHSRSIRSIHEECRGHDTSNQHGRTPWVQESGPNEHDSLGCNQLPDQVECESPLFNRKLRRPTYEAIPKLLGLGTPLRRNPGVKPIGDDTAKGPTNDIEQSESGCNLATLGLIPSERLLIPGTENAVQCKFT